MRDSVQRRQSTSVPPPTCPTPTHRPNPTPSHRRRPFDKNDPSCPIYRFNVEPPDFSVFFYCVFLFNVFPVTTISNMFLLCFREERGSGRKCTWNVQEVTTNDVDFQLLFITIRVPPHTPLNKKQKNFKE